MRLNIGKANGIPTQMPCHEDLVAKTVSGVKSERKLNNWSASLYRLRFRFPRQKSLLKRKQVVLRLRRVTQNRPQLLVSIE